MAWGAEEKSLPSFRAGFVFSSLFHKVLFIFSRSLEVDSNKISGRALLWSCPYILAD